MAKGDIITGRIAGAGSFQPAAGVEIMITAVTNSANGNSGWGINAGGATDWMFTVPAISATYAPPSNHKIGITNTGYLQSETGGSYSGVQVK